MYLIKIIVAVFGLAMMISPVHAHDFRIKGDIMLSCEGCHDPAMDTNEGKKILAYNHQTKHQPQSFQVAELSKKDIQALNIK